MKKEYIAPEIYSVDFEDDITVVAGSNNIGVGGGDVPDEDPNAAPPKRRGAWGDLWS